MKLRKFRSELFKLFRKSGFVFLVLLQFTVLNAQNADIGLLRKINVNRNEKFDGTFKVFTESASPVSISLPVGIMATGLVKKDKELFIKGLTIGSGILLASAVSTSLKYSINRTRPFVTYPDIQKATDADSPSFPSGHTSDAFSTAAALSLNYPKWYVIAPAYTWAGAVAYSRMHLGVHYPSDVLMGAVTGTLSAYLAFKAQKWIGERRK